MITKHQVLTALVDAFVQPIQVYTMEDGRRFTVFERGDGAYILTAFWTDNGYPTFTEKEVIAQFTIPVTAKPMGTHVPETRWFVERVK